MAPSRIDLIVGRSLKDFSAHLKKSRWRGREREAVSLFTFGFMQTHFDDPTSIGIECAVKQLARRGKRQVCKDIVIWPEPGMNAWDSNWNLANDPVCILEWKVAFKRSQNGCPSSGDVRWLKRFAKRRPNFVGYAIGVDLFCRTFHLRVTRVTARQVNNGWLEVA